MKPPYIPLYVRDLLSSMWVDQMDDQQFGWYIRMLLRSWDYEVPCHIPNTPEMILLFAKAKKEDFDRKGWIVLDRFKVTEDGKYIYNRRLLSEYETIIGKCKANAKAAKKRWGGTAEALRKESKRNADGMRTHTKRTAGALPAESERNAIPEPEADTESKPVETKPSARRARGTPNASQVAKAQCQTRHSRSQQIVMGWYQDWAGIECPWDGAEGKNLKGILDAWPRATDEQFIRCLENIALSDCIPKGTRPREWLGDLPKFLHGPLDQFWKSKHQGNGNGNGNSKDQQRNARNREEIIRGITGQNSGRDALPDGPAVPERHHGGSERLLERNPDRARAAIAGTDS